MLTQKLKGQDYEENYNYDFVFEDVTEDDDYTKLLDVASIADHDLLTNYIGSGGKE